MSGRAAGDPVLDLAGLTVAFPGVGTVLDGVDLRLAPGRCLAVVGESGAGKSVLARSLVGLAGEGGSPARTSSDRFLVAGRDVRRATAAQWRSLRGRQVGFVLQDALGSLDPLRTVGAEVGETLRLRGVGRIERRRRVLEALARAGLDEPQTRAAQRPGELSGGMRQRALIASAIVGRAPLLVADEPTTALDATTARGVLELLAGLRDRGTSIVLVTHDLSAVARLADEVAVLEAGRIVEHGETGEVLGRPRHPRTRTLLDAVPRGPRRPRGSRGSRGPSEPLPEPAAHPSTRGERASSPRGRSGTASGEELGEARGVDRGEAGREVLRATGLRHHYRLPGGRSLAALDGVDLSVRRGESLGIVGESGSGKSTLARMLLAAERPDEGRVDLAGAPWTDLSERRRRIHRGRIRLVPQDPLGSFDPRWNAGTILRAAIDVAGTDHTPRDLLEAVRLPVAVLDRRPRALSGGQRQRLAIARALAADPEVLVLDEPVSALDVTVQASILDLLTDLARRTGTALVFISHDLAVVRTVCERVAVMHRARLVEEGPVEAVWAAPAHPATRALLEAAEVPIPAPEGA
ncbi:nickel ABC transporter ATP-binding protein NikE [Pseudactinotalea sp. HY160]|uniref:nickel ABC transporter ATP-binding protein NikE n=1 Tax=Pseudactinotalea sp. HY160 TaxID=2654490 RepID=UPI00128CD6AF|nr:ABC transporter ATP-binding protein [Pseudactinotalea sp. HY160]MPV49685.1 nickel ABC transporter ATP-binding protein NikE [Pseudactinotalea sp. HY160]